jgi:hypothetical protein
MFQPKYPGDTIMTTVRSFLKNKIRRISKIYINFVSTDNVYVRGTTPKSLNRGGINMRKLSAGKRRLLDYHY